MSRGNRILVAGMLALLVTGAIVYHVSAAEDATVDERIATSLEKLVRVQVVGLQLTYEQQNLTRAMAELDAAQTRVAQPAPPRPSEDYFAKLEAEHPRLAAQQRATFDKQDADAREAQSKISALQRETAAIRTRIEVHLQTLQRIEKGN